MRLLLVVWMSACSYTPPSPSAEDPPPDAMPFDATACPAEYEAVGGLPSRYRVADAFANGGTGRTWSEAAAACIADGNLDAATHLVVFETAAERAEVWQTFSPRTNFQWIWTGTFESERGFSTIFGQPVATPAWAPGEPRDRPGEDGDALAHGHPNDQSADGDLLVPRVYALDFACECDGRPATAAP